MNATTLAKMICFLPCADGFDLINRRSVIFWTQVRVIPLSLVSPFVALYFSRSYSSFFRHSADVVPDDCVSWIVVFAFHSADVDQPRTPELYSSYRRKDSTHGAIHEGSCDKYFDGEFVHDEKA